MSTLMGISAETMEQLQSMTASLYKTDGGDITVDGRRFTKSITTALGLTGYNLAAPSQKLYPVLSPLRNMIPRKMAPIGAPTANWKAITGINTGRIEASVAFGARNSDIAFSLVNRSATYKSFGLDGKEQDEGVWMGRKFEDVRAFGALAVLQSLMIEEENLILGALSDVEALGTCPTPSVGTRIAADGGTWGAADNIYLACVALPLYGAINSYTGFGVGGTPLPLDLTQPLGRHSQVSAVRTQAITATTDSFTFTVTPVNGAFAYAWFVAEGIADPGNAARYLAAFTTAPRVKLTGPSANTGATAASCAADTSGDANAFAGLYPQICAAYHTLTTLSTAGTCTIKQVTGASGSNYVTRAIVADFGGVTPAVGAGGIDLPFTSDNAGGIVELDAVLKAMWDYNRVGPNLLIMNSQEAQNLTKKMAGSTGLQYRVNLQQGEKGFKGGIYVGSYTNKFTSTLTPGSPDEVDFMIHPNVPPGYALLIAFRVPYPNSNVENVLEMEMLQEYADFEWARDTREYKHGVYANGVLKHQFPAGCAILRGIGNG